METKWVKCCNTGRLEILIGKISKQFKKLITTQESQECILIDTNIVRKLIYFTIGVVNGALKFQSLGTQLLSLIKQGKQ